MNTFSISIHVTMSRISEINHLRVHWSQVRVTFLVKASKSHTDNDAG